VLVAVDARYFRPTEVDILIGDPTKARLKLDWEPTTLFSELVKEMVEADLAEVDREHHISQSSPKRCGSGRDLGAM
jgi:GDPmannose 4,6-dehydratase